MLLYYNTQSYFSQTMFKYNVAGNAWSSINLPNSTYMPSVLQFSDGTVVYGGGRVRAHKAQSTLTFLSV